MIILSDYTLSRKGDSDFFVEGGDDCPCPDCQSPLKHRDFRRRIMKLDGGAVRTLRIERRQCTNAGCRRIHSALPDMLVPFKHYAAELIEGVLDEAIIPGEPVNEDYPCEATMHRWKLWFMANCLRIEGYLKSIGHRLLGAGEGLLDSQASPLKSLRQANGPWLAAILRTVYNSGGFLEPA